MNHHSLSLFHCKLSFGSSPLLVWVAFCFSEVIFLFIYFSLPPKREQKSILTIYSDLQKQQSVLKRISNGEHLLPVQVWHSPETEGTAQRSFGHLSAKLSWWQEEKDKEKGRKRQSKAGFGSAFGRGQDRTEMGRNQNRGELNKEKEMKTAVARDQKYKIWMQRYFNIFLTVLFPLCRKQDLTETSNKNSTSFTKAE